MTNWLSYVDLRLASSHFPPPLSYQWFQLSCQDGKIICSGSSCGFSFSPSILQLCLIGDIFSLLITTMCRVHFAQYLMSGHTSVWIRVGKKTVAALRTVRFVILSNTLIVCIAQKNYLGKWLLFGQYLRVVCMSRLAVHRHPGFHQSEVLGSVRIARKWKKGLASFRASRLKTSFYAKCNLWALVSTQANADSWLDG